jgi:tetratricopeptide (TPR) repeat protein
MEEIVMRGMKVLATLVLSAAMLAAGCATSSKGAVEPTLENAASPAWSLRSSRDEMVVAVSPARQTMQLMGTAGTVVGATISAAADARAKKKVLDALGDYDAGAVFEERLAERLTTAVDNQLMRVKPLGSTAGYRDKREAEDARRSGLARSGHDLLLDLNVLYGIYGVQGVLVAKIDGKMSTLPRGKTLWDRTIVVTAAPVLADSRLSDPTKRMTPDFSALGFSVDEAAIAQWTEDGGATLRSRFEEAIDGAISALLVDLKLAGEPLGAYYLGKQALMQKKCDEAVTLLAAAAQADPSLLDARAAHGVAVAKQGKLDEAVAMTRTLAEEHPEFGPAQYNLAYWLAVEKKDAASAKPFYAKAMELGMPQSKKVAEALGM